MSGIKFVLSPPMFARIEQILNWASLAEKSDFDAVWVTDINPGRYSHDTFMTLAAIAKSTTRVKVGTSICNPYTRHPVMIANAIRTLYFLSHGRAELGIGAGGFSALPQLCIELWKNPVETIRDAVSVIRDFLKNKEINKKSSNFNVCNLNPIAGAPEPIEKIELPIYIGARRPRMLELSGEIGDGTLFGSCSLEMLKISKRYVEKGLEKREKSVNKSNFVMANWMYSSIAKNYEEAKKAILPFVPSIVRMEPIEILKDTTHDVARITKINEHVEKGHMDKAVELVTDEMVDAFTLTGTPEMVINKIEEMRSLGMTHIVFGYPLGSSVEKTLDVIKSEILAVFR